MAAALRLLLLVSALAHRPVSARQSCGQATERAILAQDALRTHFFNESAGLWEQILWWQNACSLEVISHQATFAGNESLREQVEADIANTYAKTANMSRGGPTLTGYYDDEEWWALGWLRAWELTGNASYVERTDIIFDHQVDMAWNESTCGGGLMWQGYIYSEDRFGNPYKGAITNELFLMIAAKMAVLGPEDTRERYAEWAEKTWAWFRASGMINERGLVNDGLDQFEGHNEICRNNNQTEWTYNQGVILGGLAYMWELNGDDAQLATAAKIADATLTHLVHKGAEGVLAEPCEGNWMEYKQCSQDELQFKGVFVRYLGMLLDLAHREPAAVAPLGGEAALERWSDFVESNAEAIWTRAACTLGMPVGVGEHREALPLFGTSWLGPCNTMPGGLTAVAQTSALDVLVVMQELACRDEEPQEGAGSAAEAAAPEPAIL